MKKVSGNQSRRTTAPAKGAAATVGARRRDEAGDTLIEVLLALVVLAIASVALIIAFGTSISASADHRSLSSTSIVLDAVSQEVTAEMQANSNLYSACQTFSTYVAEVPMAIPAPYTTQYTANFAVANPIEYWNSAISPNGGFQVSCGTAEWGQAQQVGVTVTQLSTGRTFTNYFVVASPYASASTNGGSQTGTFGTAAQLVFTQQPGSGATGQELATQPQVTVEDASGNVVTTDLSPVLLTITNGNGATISNCSSTETEGVVSFTGCTVNEAGTYTLTATDPEMSGSFYSQSFTISSATDYIVFTQQPVGGQSGKALNTQPIVEVYTNGHQDTTWAGTITLTTSGGDLSNCAPVATTTGYAAFSGCEFAGAYYYNPISQVYLATPYTMTATASNSTPTSPGTSQTFEVTGAGTANQLVFTQQPTGYAGTNPATAFTVQPIVDVEDSFGNIVTSGTGSNAAVSLTISSGSLTCTANPLNASGGVATFANCAGSAYGDNLTLTATSSGLANATSAAFNITNIPYYLIFTTQPVAGVSGSAFTTQPVLTVEDQNGNIVTSVTTPITLTSSGGTLSLCSGLTPNDGVIHVTTCNFAGVVNTPYTLTATMTGSFGTLTATSGYFSPSSAGAATQLVFTTAPVAGPAGSAFTTQPVIAIEDSGGNITTSTATISLSTNAGTLTGCSNLTAVQGIVDVSGCTFGAPFGTYTLTAASSPLTAATASITVSLPGPASSSTSQLSASPASVSANGVATTSIGVTLEDAYGNPIAGKTIAISDGSGSSVITAVSATTNASGMAAFTATDTVSQTVTFSATDTTDNVTLTPTASVIFYGTPTQIVLSGCSSNFASTTTCTATATIEDANGYTVTGYNGTVAFNQTAGTGSVTGLTGTTSFTNGVASVVLTGNKVGTVTIDAVGDSITSNAVSFSIVAGPPSKVALTSNCGATLVSSSTCTATATIEDANGNTVTTYNGTVAFNQTAGTGSVTGLTGTTSFTNGVANVNLTGNKAGTVTIDAVGDSITSNTVSFSVTAGPATQVVLSGCSTSIASNTNCTATATLEDANGNTVTTYNGTVAFNQTAGTGSVTGLTGTTSFTGGVANVTLTGNKVGTVTIDAVGDGFTSGTVTFSVTPGTATQIVLTSNCGATLVSSSTCTATATLEDANGNTETGYNGTVTFNQTAGTGSVTGLTGTTRFTGGVANVTLTGNKVGPVTIDAVGDGITSNTISFTVTVGPASKVVLSGNCSGNIASGSTCTATATLEDANGNTETGYNGTVAFNQTAGTGSVTGLTGTTSFTGGVANVTLTGNKVGTVTIDAVGDGFTSGTASFSVIAGPAHQIVLSTTCGATLVSSSTCTATATLEDANGNTETGYVGNATFTQSGAGTVGGTGSVAFTNGVATTTLTGETVGSVTVGATGDGFTGSPTISFTVTVGPASKVVLSGNCSGNIASGSTCTATATLEDANGNTETGYNGTVAFNQTAGTGSVTGLTGTTSFTGGVANVTLTGNKVGTVTIDAVGDGFTSGTVTFSVTPGTATQVVLSGNCSGNIASGSTCTATATLEDANGNTETGYNGTVAFNQTAGTGSVTGLTGTTSFTGGVANVTLTGNKVGTVTIDAVGDGFTSGTASFSVIAGPASASTSTVAASPTSVTANGTTSSTITVTLEDANSNPISGKTITLTAGSGSSVITTVSGTTNASGVATFTVTDTTAQAVTYTAKDTTDNVTITQTATVTFVAGPASASTSTVAASPTSVTANGTTSSTITVTLEDANSNPISGKTITLTAGSGSSVITTVSGTTNASGVATFTVTDTTAQAVTYTAKDTTDNVTITQTATVTFTVGPASKVVLSGNCSGNIASGSTCTATATLEDANGNTETGYNGTVAFNQTAGTGSVTGLTGTTSFTGGVANVTLTGNKVGTVTIDAVGDGFTSGTASFSVIAGPASASTSTVAASPTSVTANGTTSSTITVTLEDANSNPISGKTITLTAGSGSSVITTVSGTTNASGVATFTVTDTTAQAVTYTAKDTTDNVTITQTATVTFTVGPASKVVLSGNCSGNIASGSTCTATATLEDANGNTETGYNGTVAFNQTAGTGSVTGLTGTTSFTGGVANVTLTGNKVGTVTIDAVGDGFTSGTASFSVIAGPAHQIVLSTTCGATLVSSSTCTATATLEDANGNTETGYVGNATFTQSGAGTVGGTGSVAFTNGVATTTLTGETVGGVTVGATGDGFTGSPTISFTVTVGPPSGSTSTAIANPTSVTANGTSTSTITVTLTDTWGNPISGKTITLTAGSGSSVITTVSGTTNASGVATFTVTDTTAQAVTYTAKDTTDSVTLTEEPTVTFTAGNASKVVLSTSCGATLTAGTSCTATATLEDANGNTVTTYNGAVAFSQSGTGSVTGLTGTTSFTNGVASVTVHGNKVGSVTIGATGDGFTASPGISLTVAVGTASSVTSTVSANPTAVLDNNSISSTITVTLEDAEGNPVANKVITLSQGTGHSTITTVSGTTNASGVASFTVKDATNEAVTYTATDTTDSVTISQTAIVYFKTNTSNGTNAYASTSTVVASPTSVVDDGTSTSTITVTLEAASGAAVANKTITLSQGTGNSVITTVSGTTNASGVATFTVTDTTAQAVTYTAKDTTDNVTITQTATVNFHA